MNSQDTAPFSTFKETRLIKRTSLFALAAFTLVAPAVHAQTLSLNSGDVVTVDGTGTHGTIGGAPVSSSTATYTGSNYAALISGTAVFTLGTGGTLSTGNNAAAVLTSSSGPFIVRGGTLRGGNNGYGLFTYGSGTTTIMGGALTAGTGGTALYASGSGPITITGGTFNGGSGGYELYVYQSAIDLYGVFDGLTLGQTQTLATGGKVGSFTGTLQNNTTAQTFNYLNSGAITLHDVAPAPEPSPLAALSLGVLGLGTLALCARRRVG